MGEILVLILAQKKIPVNILLGPYISLILRTHFFFPIKVFYLYKCTISVEPEKVHKITVLMYFSRLFSQLGFLQLNLGILPTRIFRTTELYEKIHELRIL